MTKKVATLVLFTPIFFFLEMSYAQTVPEACSDQYAQLGRCLTTHSESSCPRTRGRLNTCLSSAGVTQFTRNYVLANRQTIINGGAPSGPSTLAQRRASRGARYNLGWGYTGIDWDRNPHSLAREVNYFRNNCIESQGEYPCSPALGVQSDRSLMCVKSSSDSGACLTEANRINGIANLNLAVSSCRSDTGCAEDAMILEVQTQIAALGRACTGGSGTCNRLTIHARSSDIGSLSADRLAALSGGNERVTSDNRVENVPPATGNNCEEVSEFLSPRRADYDRRADAHENTDVAATDVTALSIVRSASPRWKSLVQLAARRCGRPASDIYRTVGACNRMEGDDFAQDSQMKRALSGSAYNTEGLERELDLSLTTFNQVFCSSRSNVLQRANQLPKGIGFTLPRDGSASRGNPSWLANCLGNNNLQREEETREVEVDGQTYTRPEEVITSNVFRAEKAANGERSEVTSAVNRDHRNCQYVSFDPNDPSFNLLDNANNGKLILRQRNPTLGQARCMIVSSSKSIRRPADQNRAVNYRTVLDLVIPLDRSTLSDEYRFEVDNIQTLSERFIFQRWECPQKYIDPRANEEINEGDQLRAHCDQLANDGDPSTNCIGQ